MEIVDFQPEFAPAFKAFNEAWIRRHYAIERKDVEILGDPQGQVIDKGGLILFAVDAGEPVGCCAMIPMADGGWQLNKMAVDERRRRGGAGRAILQACIDRARALGAPRLYLESGLALAPALALYRSLGFVDLPPDRRPNSDYGRVSVWMELKL